MTGVDGPLGIPLDNGTVGDEEDADVEFVLPERNSLHKWRTGWGLHGWFVGFRKKEADQTYRQ